MRLMQTLIEENGLHEELNAMVKQYLGLFSQSISLYTDPELDEPSDAEDPEQQLRAELADCRAELADRSTMIEAVQGALECRRARKSPAQKTADSR